MMKNPIFWPLRSLLIVAVIPRDSLAFSITLGPIDTGTAPYNIIKGIEQLTTTFTWLQNNMPSLQQFNETIDNLEKNIKSLPSDREGNRRKMLVLLYKLKDRFNEARTVLNVTAKLTISYCDDLNNLFDNINHSGELLEHTASAFVSYIGVINDHLEDLSDILMEIMAILTDLKEFEKEFNVTLSSNTETINESLENMEDIHQVIDTSLPEIAEEISSAIERYVATRYPNITNPAEKTEAVIASLNPATISSAIEHYVATRYPNIPNPAEKAAAVIASQNLPKKLVTQIMIKIDIRRNENRPVKIDKAHESISSLLAQVAKINEYIEDMDSMEDIESGEDIEFNFTTLKVSINALRNACSNYLNQ